MIAAGLMIGLGLVFVGYATLQVAQAINRLTEQLALGVRMTDQLAPSAQEMANPPAEGVVSWPAADGWRPAPPADHAWKEAELAAWQADIAAADKARTSDNNHDEPPDIIDESPELRGKRGGRSAPDGV